MNDFKKGTCEIVIANNNFLDLENYLENKSIKPNLISKDEKNILFFKQKYNCVTIEEIFTNYSDKTFDTYKNTVKTIQHYKKCLQNEKFENYSILDGLEYSLINYVLFIEKIKKILQENINVIFIFDKFYFEYFIILEEAKKAGFEINSGYEIIDFSSKSAKIIDPYTINNNFNRKKTISKYLKYYSRYSKNVSNVSKAKLILNLSKKIIPYLINKMQKKIKNDKYEKLKNDVNKSITKKISKFKKIEYAFFLSGGRKDVIEAYCKIMDKLIQDKIEFLIFTSDPITASYVSKYKKYRIDLFEDIIILENKLMHAQEGKEFRKNIEKNACRNNLEIIFFKNCNSEIINKLFHSIAISIIVDLIINQLKLKKIVLVEGPILGKVVSRLAKNNGIPTLSIETLLIDHNELFSLSYKADTICVYGKQAMDALLYHGYEKERIVITGNPIFDYINSNNKKSRKNLEKILKVEDISKVITIAMSRWHDKDEEWFSKLINYCNDKNYQVIIKLHPRYKIDFEYSEKKISVIKNNCIGKNFQFLYDIDLQMLLTNSDLVISDYSGVGVEAMLIGIPVIVVNFIKEEISNSPKFHDTGMAMYVEKYNLLEKYIELVLQKNEFYKQEQHNNQKIVDMYNHLNDGKSIERISKLITNF